MVMILSICSIPNIPSCSPGFALALCSVRARDLFKISFISVLFPEPDTPVTTHMTLRGIFTSIFCRLFCLAFFIVIYPFGSRRRSGISILRLPLIYWPVVEVSCARIAAGGPATTTSPPSSPAPGPISTIQSAFIMVSSSCSTTMTVFPISLRLFNIPMSFALSRGCNPMDGSSRI